MRKYLSTLLLAVALISSVPAVAADKSISACGHVFVKHDDGTWTVFQNGEQLATYGTGYTLADLKEVYCD